MKYEYCFKITLIKSMGKKMILVTSKPFSTWICDGGAATTLAMSTWEQEQQLTSTIWPLPAASASWAVINCNITKWRPTVPDMRKDRIFKTCHNPHRRVQINDKPFPISFHS